MMNKTGATCSCIRECPHEQRRVLAEANEKHNGHYRCLDCGAEWFSHKYLHLDNWME